MQYPRMPRLPCISMVVPSARMVLSKMVVVRFFVGRMSCR